MLLHYFLIALCSALNSNYEEHIKISQLKNGKIIFDWNFETTIKFKPNHYTLFPRAIGEIITAFDLIEFHLTFSQGRWDYERWKYNKNSKTSGLELYAWLKNSNLKENWSGLTNSLSGLFCASLNFLDEKVSATPKLTYKPNFNDDNYILRYGSLPKEVVCTENLTPWSKLLPCKTKAGISTLFNAYKLFDANFHSAGVHLKPVCNRNDDFNSDLTKNCSLKFQQTLTLVVDPIRNFGNKDWSLNKIFERKIPKACAVSSKSLVELSLPNKTGFKLNNSPDKILDNGNFIFDLQNKIDFDIGVEWESNQELNFDIDTKESFFHAHRYLTGFGQEKGGINIDLYNYRDQPLTVAVFQMIPWYLKFYLHTLQFQSMPLNHDFNAESLILRNRDILNETYYQPAVERMRPTILEYKLSLPAKSKIVMKVDFDKSFIRYTEHPPDANRGFDIGPAIITFGKKEEKFYTNNLLINLPTPDFSMPYNVITLTCTVLAFLFAGIFNLMIKNYKPV
ncbi:hypothetical protein HDU92_000765 [Lobulomyces angularis]|nr:hypothetical protein HDU92_000765 [Lobulomyces angularis]